SSERRVQRMLPALKTFGEAKPLWKVCAEFSARSRDGEGKPVFNAKEVLDEIVANVSEFAQVTEEGLAGTGCLMPRAGRREG
ncbi:MAG: hypothetical protein ABUL72_04950, partial [Armatimonadota bacterium]